MKHHPAAERFPMMDAKRFEELKANIAAHGLREPITLCDEMILDGRNRYKACEELGITAASKEFTGDPYAYAWSMNGERRDLVDEQRYLIWKYLSEDSEEYQAEQQRIRDEANKKRSKAAEKRPRKPTGVFEEQPVREQSVHAVDSRQPERHAKASASKTNPGAVARGDKLAKERPDLAEKVMRGEMKPADAHREMKRAEVKRKLDDLAVKEIDEPTGQYDVIVIDPPWPMQKFERDERPNQVEFDYPRMNEAELAAFPLPAADDCHVFCWTTQKFLPMAIRLLQAWSLKYIFTMVWHKPGGFQPVGLAQFNCEFVLYARRGAPTFLDTKAFCTCFNAPRTKHSEKPEEFYDLLRRVTAGRRIDIFNNRPIEGFDGWGKGH